MEGDILLRVFGPETGFEEEEWPTPAQLEEAQTRLSRALLHRASGKTDLLLDPETGIEIFETILDQWSIMTSSVYRSV